ncbi:alpha/beta fold hydrolase [Paenactinomyces guangxiensis]|uniref:Alpha/beta hydrolase n=1 Tax=Paenactinomyces guangxiensis TaxID=1490290 RepID=A0A7W1WUA8_9BACL|nr:alpha/beta hydrolase [Paenactinomyces guangxiensis]MBA4496077.1 alpha/beta hydrolase [Paenactinomyces guangxiensis]MBH8593165.1 alpha/beta hydrolase [Paenactinomyces guangxiensis]
MKRGLKNLIIILSIVLFLAAGLFWYNQYEFRQAEVNFPPNGNFITVEGTKLHYIRKGSGKPLVFLHGGVLTGNDFEKVMEIAAKQGYQAISFDRPGYGYSEKPKNEEVTPIVQARLIHGALKKLGIGKPILVGHSWSGILVLSYALSYPDEVSGIVTLGAVMYKEGYPAENGDPISAVVTTPIIGDALLNTLLKSPLGTGLAKNILKETFAPEPVPSDYRKAALALWLRPTHFKANREDVLAFSPTAEKISNRYKNIKHPMVIVVGNNDPFGTKEQACRLQKYIPHAKLMVLPHVAHMIPQNHPKAVMDAIKTLIEK